jgi:oxygen-dependent protoporphyrinogen oxidase
MSEPKIAIVGGGISGLALAWSLRRRGLASLVLEASSRAGGRISSTRVEGFICERGPLGLSHRDPGVRSLVRAAGLENQIVPALHPDRRAVLLGHRLSIVPRSLRGLLGSRILTKAEKGRALLDLILPRGFAARGQEESLAAFGRRRLGAGASEKTLFPLLPGGYAYDPERTSVTEAFPSLAQLERERRSLLRAWSTLAMAENGLASFQTGMELLPRSLGAALGPDLRLSTELRRVSFTERGLRLSVQERGVAREIEAGAVVLAIPAPAAAAVLEPSDAPLAEALEGMRYAPVALAFFGFPQPERPRGALDGHGFYVPPREPSPLAGGVFLSSLFPWTAPPGQGLLVARFGGGRRPELAALQADALAERSRAELSAIGVPVETRLIHAFHHQMGLPQYELGHRQRLEAVRAGEARHPGLFFAGDAYEGPGITHCVADADRVAERIAAGVAMTLGR